MLVVRICSFTLTYIPWDFFLFGKHVLIIAINILLLLRRSFFIQKIKKSHKILQNNVVVKASKKKDKITGVQVHVFRSLGLKTNLSPRGLPSPRPSLFTRPALLLNISLVSALLSIKVLYIIVCVMNTHYASVPVILIEFFPVILRAFVLSWVSEKRVKYRHEGWEGDVCREVQHAHLYEGGEIIMHAWRLLRRPRVRCTIGMAVILLPSACPIL